MSLALLQNALLLPLELAVNGLLALDAASAQRLQQLEGHTLAIDATQPAATLFVSVRGGKLCLASVHEGPETARLHGSASALLGLLLRRERIESLHAHQVELRGDTGFVQRLQALLLGLEIDWEFHVSRLIGDIPTQAVADGARSAGAQVRKAGARLRANLAEYLNEESGLLPGAEALEAFYRDVADLQLRVDRLQARLDRFKPRA